MSDEALNKKQSERRRVAWAKRPQSKDELVRSGSGRGLLEVLVFKVFACSDCGKQHKAVYVLDLTLKVHQPALNHSLLQLSYILMYPN
jgi:hypothetical protein